MFSFVFPWLPWILALFHIFIGPYFVNISSICLFSLQIAHVIDPNILSFTGFLLAGGLTLTWSLAVCNYTEFFNLVKLIILFLYDWGFSVLVFKNWFLPWGLKKKYIYIYIYNIFCSKSYKFHHIPNLPEMQCCDC